MAKAIEVPNADQHWNARKAMAMGMPWHYHFGRGASSHKPAAPTGQNSISVVWVCGQWSTRPWPGSNAMMEEFNDRGSMPTFMWRSFFLNGS